MSSKELSLDYSGAWRAPVGPISPLWPLYCAAAGAGLAWWWAAEWSRAAARMAPVLAWPAKTPAVEPLLAAEDKVVQLFVAAAETAPAAVEDTVAELPAAAETVLEEPEFASAQAFAVVEDIAEAEPLADDLTVLRGVGPKVAEALAARGITRFAQIAAWTAEEAAEIDRALALKGRPTRNAWVEQAGALTRG